MPPFLPRHTGHRPRHRCNPRGVPSLPRIARWGSTWSHTSERPPTLDVMTYAEQLAEAVDYDDETEGSVDALIAYKNALEDTLEALEGGLRRQGLEIANLISQG